MVSATILCNNILHRAFKDSTPVTPMKLQKLMYFIYKDYLKKTGNSILSEQFQAWKYGPVLQSVYNEFKTFGSSPITKYAKDSNGEVFIVDESSVEFLEEIINKIWNDNKCYTGIELSRRTHQPGTAWDKAVQANRNLLTDEDIKNDF